MEIMVQEAPHIEQDEPVVISTRRQRVKVAIEYETPVGSDAWVTGVFHVKGADELTLDQQLRLGQLGKRLEALGGADAILQLNAQQTQQLAAGLRECASWVNHDIPEDVFTQLGDTQKLALITAFKVAPTSTGKTLVQSENNSLDSADSTGQILEM